MKKWVAALTARAVVVAAGVLVIRNRAQVQREHDRVDSLKVATTFLRTWEEGRFPALGALTEHDPDAGDSFANLADRLQITSLRLVPGAQVGHAVPYTATAQLRGLGALSWSSTVDTVKTSRGWRVDFRSSTVYPGLVNGQVLSRSQPLVSHGELTDLHGVPLRAASADLAANVLGRSGANPTGLERIYADKLAGSSGGEVQIVARGTGEVVSTVKSFPPKPAAPVRTTLDLTVQRAGEQVLAGVGGEAALVAIDARTGEVRAVVNHPVVGLPPAFTPQAPGSTFKVVVAAAALARGITPDTMVDCPEKAVFGGKEFRNDEPLPARMTFATAFARSCNTAFLTIADGFPKGTAASTAKDFGFDRGDLLPVAGHGGQLPPPAGTSEAYADIIGQGRVEASPLLLASMSAAVASGSWRMPHLVTAATPGNALAPAVASGLRRLMAGVVTSGTAASAGLPPGTAGKTGTAQYGDGTHTHAWFTGYRGDLAFCVYVKDGASGGSVAAPLAARFLRLVGG
jgi:hypothetical protein